MRQSVAQEISQCVEKTIICDSRHSSKQRRGSLLFHIHISSLYSTFKMTNHDAETVTGRLRKASVSAADAILNFNPQPGM
jgi:hypothetical protein